MLTMSESRTAASASATCTTCASWGNFSFAQAMYASTLPWPRPATLTVSIPGRTARNASSEVRFMGPGPMMPTTRASSRARKRAPTPGIAPVR